MGKKTGPNPTDRGKKGTKRSLLVEAAGIPLSAFAEAANVNDMCLVGANLLELDDLPVRRPSPRRFRQGMCMDKGYDYPEIRALVRMYGFTPHIRSRGEERKSMQRRRGYRPRRWVVGRTHSWYNRFRDLLIRWCKKEENYTAQLHLASAVIIGSFIGLSG